MTSDINRRRFLGSAVASGVITIVPRHVLGGAAHVAPSAKVTLAHVGMGTQGFRELGALLADPEIQIVAVCDPNTDSDDYMEWGKNDVRDTIRTYLGKPTWREHGGCPGGREVGREVVDTYYASQRTAERFKSCAAFADFRELLEQVKDLDAVKIMTPDHLHATVSVAAMKKGKHLMMHKPLANRLHEGRLVVDTARQTKVATHLMAYGLGSGNASIAQRIKVGVIGPLREIHNWTNRPVWPQYTRIPKTGRRSPRAWIGTCGWDRRWTVPITRTTPTRYSAVGTISAAAPWRTWAFTACGPCSRRWTWAFRRGRGMGHAHLLGRRSRMPDR